MVDLPAEVLPILIQSIFIPPTAKINCTRPRDAWLKCGNAQEKAETLKGFLCSAVAGTCGTEFISKYQWDQISLRSGSNIIHSMDLAADATDSSGRDGSRFERCDTGCR